MNVLVTGGASGIGRAACEVLAARGDRVAVADRDSAGAHAIAADLPGAYAIGLDVADEASVIDAFRRVHSVFGALEGLVTAAGIVDTTVLSDLDVATWERVLRVNLIGTFLCIREAAKVMPPGGRVCTVASIAGKRGGGLFGTAAYAASKGGVLALTRSAARDLAARGIAVNGVAPGPIETPLLAPALANAELRGVLLSGVPAGRTGTPREVGEAIAFLMSADASYATGEVLTVDGGVVMD